MIDPHPDLTTPVIWGLGWFWLAVFLMNTGWAFLRWRYRACGASGAAEDSARRRSSVRSVLFWGFYAVLLLAIAALHFAMAGRPSEFWFRLPEAFKDTVDELLSNPVAYFVLWIAAFGVPVCFPAWVAKPTVGWCALNAALVFLGLSLTDWDFRQIVGKPDNVPIVGMLFLVGFFTWLYFHRATDNDRRLAEGRPLREQENNDEVLVWPDLVYIELICMVALTALLIVWGIALKAPLEEPASPVRTPNPSKAPWYFLGLQELLVYFDPWLAGVVFPALIIVGLMAIPYLDFNQKGNGYYTFQQRKFAVVMFMFGFVVLWVSMIGLGTFLRGPNWNFFGIYERWDVHKLEVLDNVNLSEYFYLHSPDWLPWAGPLPQAPPEASTAARLGYILAREAPGIVLLFLYFGLLPPILAATVFRTFYLRMGFVRYVVFIVLLLLMALLPIKMILRWAFNLKYIVAIPEWFFNI
ncbi:MAG: hypothetical protein GXP27_03520 [Planctomycetes bacterium]|nr:hypothetical protein [Planctomycetota bacterium]